MLRVGHSLAGVGALLVAVFAGVLGVGGVMFFLQARRISQYDPMSFGLVFGYGIILAWTVAMLWMAFRLLRIAVVCFHAVIRNDYTRVYD